MRTNQDMIAAICALRPASGNRYTAALAGDGSILVTRNGERWPLPVRLWWGVTRLPAARANADADVDKVAIEDAGTGVWRTADVQEFLDGLT